MTGNGQELKAVLFSDALLFANLEGVRTDFKAEIFPIVLVHQFASGSKQRGGPSLCTSKQPVTRGKVALFLWQVFGQVSPWSNGFRS